MELENKYLSASESLEIITAAINRTKDNFKENSFYFMLWGWLIASASLLFFLLHQFTLFKYYFLPFPVLVIAGIVISMFRYFKSKALSGTETYSSYYFNWMWLVLGISFILIVFVTLVQHIAPFTYTMIIAGIGTLMSGLIMKFKPLKIGGILFFISSIVCAFLPDAYKPLLSCISIISGYLIPGYLLNVSHS